MNVTKKTKGYNIEKSQMKWGYFFITPGLIGFTLFNLIPMLFSLIVSMTEWNIITPMKFIGLENYKIAFSDPLTWKSLWATAYYTLLAVPLITITTLFIAMLLNTRIKGISIFRTIFYIPSIVPMVASTAMWMFIYNPTYGLLNGILRNFNLPTGNFIYSISGVIPCLVMMALWAAGNTVIVYLAGLQGISQELYEAAAIDGAKRRQAFRYITAPLMTPIIFFNVVTTTIGCLQTFTQAYIMTDGGPANNSLFFSLLIYRNAFKFGKMGYASALSWLLFMVVALLTFIIFDTSKNWVYYETGGDE